MDEPAVVARARKNAERMGFELSSDSRAGELLAVLAASVPYQGAVLELGTGAGVGTAWIASGLAGRDDVRLVTVDIDEDVSRGAQANGWPASVQFLVGDAVALLPSLGAFDLVFADAQGGKWFGLDLTIAAVAPGGFLLVDDMAPREWWTDEHRTHQEGVRRTLLSHPELAAGEMDWSTGLILCARRRRAT
jgi:predicted O-methyltransferase YrrM